MDQTEPRLDGPSRSQLPSFLIIGAPRCGTSALAHHLSAHPEIFMAPEKEVRFFTEHYPRGLAWYATRFAGARSHQVMGEATPRYMYDQLALSRIAASIPDVRLIAQLRNPVDRAYSHYWMRRSGGREPREFGTAVRDELDGARRGSELGRGLPYLAAGRYVDVLRRVSEIFSRDRLLVTILEELLRDPVDGHRVVFRHVGVDDAFTVPNPHGAVNAYREVRFVAVRRLTRPLPKRARAFVTLLNTRRSSYPMMDPAIRAELLAHFESYQASLEDWLGREIPAWRS